MTWEPKNKTDDDDDAVLTDSEDNKEKDDLAADNRGDRVGEEARRSLDDTGELFFFLLSAQRVSVVRQRVRIHYSVRCCLQIRAVTFPLRYLRARFRKLLVVARSEPTLTREILVRGLRY